METNSPKMKNDEKAVSLNRTMQYGNISRTKANEMTEGV